METERFIEVSAPALELFGYTLQEMRQMTTTDIVIPEQKHIVAERREAAAKRWGDGREWTCRRKNGSLFRMRIRYQMLEHEGRMTYFAFVTHVEEVAMPPRPSGDTRKNSNP